MDYGFTTATDMVASARYEYAEYTKQGGTDPFNVFFGRYRKQHSFRPGKAAEVQADVLQTFGLSVDPDVVLEPVAELPDLDTMEPDFSELAAIEAEINAEQNIQLPLFDPSGEIPIPAPKTLDNMPILTTEEYQAISARAGFPKLTGLTAEKRGRGRPKGAKNKPKDPATVEAKAPRVTKYNLILDYVKANPTETLAGAHVHFSHMPANTVTVYYYRAKKELDIA
jgi:hypothetical protein